MIYVALVILVAGALLVASWLGVARNRAAWPPRGSFLQVGGASIHYTVRGHGTPLVCLHGASANLRDFEASITPLLENRFRVISIDRPGLGHSTRPGGDWWTPLDQANAVRAVLRHLAVDRPILLGHSWSGALVMSYLVHYPREITGAILLAPATRSWFAPSSLYNRISRWPVVGALFGYLLVYPVGSLLMDSGIRSVFRHGRVPDGYRQRTGVDLLLQPQSWRANADDLCLLNDYLKSRAHMYDWVRHPVLALIGDHDTIVSNEIHTLALKRQMPQLDVVSMADTGHAPHHEHPAAVARLIREFVNGLNITSN